MPSILPYRRAAAVEYARKWANSRNPKYYDFSAVGGDCTNFASQCLYTGAGGVMNHTKDLGWYYYNVNQRAPAWTAAVYFARFLTRKSQSQGPFARLISLEQAEPGDFVQLKFPHLPDVSHTLVVVKKGNPTDPGGTRIAAHSQDSIFRRVDSYSYQNLQVLHILGVNQ